MKWRKMLVSDALAVGQDSCRNEWARILKIPLKHPKILTNAVFRDIINK